MQHGQKNALPDAVMQFTAQVQQSGWVTRRGNDLYRYDAYGRLVTKNVLSSGFRPQQWRYRRESSRAQCSDAGNPVPKWRIALCGTSRELLVVAENMILELIHSASP